MSKHLCRNQTSRCTKYGLHAIAHCAAAQFVDICFSDTRLFGINHEAILFFGLAIGLPVFAFLLWHFPDMFKASTPVAPGDFAIIVGHGFWRRL